MKNLVCSLFTLMSFTCFPQLGLQWAKGFNGGLGRGYSVHTDAQGNVFTTGEFQGQMDFDPGSGTLTYSAQNSNPDAFVSKLDGAGNLVWAKHISGNSVYGYDITTDKWGFVYLVGTFSGLVDFDPGPNTYTFTSTSANPYVVKLSASGDLVWAKQFPSSNGSGYSIGCDTLGHVVFTGQHFGTTDFDPGAGTYTLSVLGVNDAFICCIDTGGVFQWAGTMGGYNCQATANDLTVDSAGSLYTTGNFRGTIDIDPSSVTQTIASSGFTVANTYLAKFSKQGNLIWAKVIGGMYSEIARDGYGNIYCSGYFDGTQDFDPGPGTHSVTTTGFFDIYILKLDSQANFSWCKTIGGSGNEYVEGMAVGRQGKVTIGGSYLISLDFDPGPSVFTMTANAGSAFIMQLDPAGNFNWAGNFEGQGGGVYTGASALYDLCLDASEVVHCTGIYVYTVDFDPGIGTTTLSTGLTGSNDDVFVAKLCTGPALLSAISGPTSACTSNTYSFAAYPSNAGGTFTWSIPSGWTTTNTVYGLLANIGQGGTLTLTTSNVCGTSGTRTLAVTSVVSPTVVISPSIGICIGGAVTLTVSGASAYSWSAGGTNTSVVISPTVNTVLTVTGTTGGCHHTNSTSVNVYPLPTVNIVGNASVCDGFPLLLQANGAASYSWSTGPQTSSITVIPSFANNNFSVTGTDANGCSASTFVVIPILNTPSVVINNPLPICFGHSVMLVASGADSYQWFNGAGSQSLTMTPATTTVVSVTGSLTNGCYATANTTVYVKPLPLVTISGTVAGCVGDTISLLATGASTYSWVGGSATAIHTIIVSGNSVYTVTGIDTSSCANTATHSIVSHPLPQIIVQQNKQVVCRKDLINLTVTGAASYTWNNNTTGSSLAYSATTTGNSVFIVAGTSQSGCKANTSYTVTVVECVGTESLSGPLPRIYPNPTESSVYISDVNWQTLEITVLDISGRTVVYDFVDRPTHTYQIHLPTEKGLYMLSLSNGRERVFYRIVVN